MTKDAYNVKANFSKLGSHQIERCTTFNNFYNKGSPSLPLHRNLDQDKVPFDRNQQRQRQQRGACSGCPDEAEAGAVLGHRPRSNLPSWGLPGDIHGFRAEGTAVAVVAAAGRTPHRDFRNFRRWILVRLRGKEEKK